MMTNKGWMVVCLLLTLLAGTSAGVVADRVVLQEEPKPPQLPKSTIHFTCEEGELDRPDGYYEERRQRMIVRWQERFSMTEDQSALLDEVLLEHGASAGDFWSETRDRYCTLRDSLRASVRDMLDEEQQQEFEEYLEERRERHERRSSGGAANGSFL
ncbi:MAG: hypothetical protein AAF690_00845 [Acidobacteriota bacterium]